MDIVKFITCVCTLLLLGVFLPSDACKCTVVNHPQWFCCNSTAAVEATFIKESQGEPSKSSNEAEKCYKIKIHQVLHGNPGLENVNCVCNALPGTDCEYKHPLDGYGIRYVIAGSYKNGKFEVTLCSCIMPWCKLTPNQVKGAEGVYRQGCTCKIAICNTPPCEPVKDTCLVQDYKGGDFKNQRENQACLPGGNGCCWQDIV